MPTTTHASIALENLSRRKEITGELRQIDEAATKDKRGYTEEESAKIEAFRSELSAIDERITSNLHMQVRDAEIERSTADLLGVMLDQRSDRPVAERRTVGHALTETDEWRAWAQADGQRGHLHVSLPGEFRAVTDGTLAAGSAGEMVVTPRLPGIRQETLDRPVALLDLVPHIPVSQASVEYVQDVTANADLIDRVSVVAEGGQKPDAGVTLDVVTEPIKTVAVMTNVTRQAAADVPQFMGYVDGRLRYALRRYADAQLIAGSGVGNNLEGITVRSGINSYAPGSAEARYKSIRHAITMMEQDETVPEIIVMNPADAEIFDLSNDATAGLHAIDTHGGLAMSGPRTAWGLRQVRTNAVASGTAVLVDPTAVAVFDRQQVTAYTTDSHGTNFAFNILTLLLEARLGVGLFQPQGVALVTFNGTA